MTGAVGIGGAGAQWASSAGRCGDWRCLQEWGARQDAEASIQTGCKPGSSNHREDPTLACWHLACVCVSATWPLLLLLLLVLPAALEHARMLVRLLTGGKAGNKIQRLEAALEAAEQLAASYVEQSKAIFGQKKPLKQGSNKLKTWTGIAKARQLLIKLDNKNKQQHKAMPVHFVFECPWLYGMP